MNSYGCLNISTTITLVIALLIIMGCSDHESAQSPPSNPVTTTAQPKTMFGDVEYVAFRYQRHAEVTSERVSDPRKVRTILEQIELVSKQPDVPDEDIPDAAFVPAKTLGIIIRTAPNKGGLDEHTFVVNRYETGDVFISIDAPRFKKATKELVESLEFR
ncbi:MAG: hypothetical protein Q8J63_03280 [Candidatus Aquicultor sp.]|nr:hypothetical protein [Candidatus Aquicultor sp.]